MAYVPPYIYIYTAPARICTPLIVSRSLRSLANNSRICGYPEAKPRENRKRWSYARAPNPRTRYSLSNLYHPGMRGFERVETRGNKKCGLCLYLIHTFGPIACIKSDVRWYKYIYIYIYIRTAPARICTPLIMSRSLHSLANNKKTDLQKKRTNRKVK